MIFGGQALTFIVIPCLLHLRPIATSMFGKVRIIPSNVFLYSHEFNSWEFKYRQLLYMHLADGAVGFVDDVDATLQTLQGQA